MGRMPLRWRRHDAMLSAMVALTEGRQMTQLHIPVIDLAKRSFQVCATDRGGAVLFTWVLSRTKLQQLL